MTEQKKQNVLEAPLVMEGNIMYIFIRQLLLLLLFAAQLLEDFSNDCMYLFITIIKNRGPAWDISDLESNRIIGQNQADMAIKLYNDDSFNVMSVDGPIDYRQKFWDISTAVVKRDNGTIAPLCAPAMVSSIKPIMQFSYFPTHTYRERETVHTEK